MTTSIVIDGFQYQIHAAGDDYFWACDEAGNVVHHTGPGFDEAKNACLLDAQSRRVE